MLFLLPCFLSALVFGLGVTSDHAVVSALVAQARAHMRPPQPLSAIFISARSLWFAT